MDEDLVDDPAELDEAERRVRQLPWLFRLPTAFVGAVIATTVAFFVVWRTGWFDPCWTLLILPAA